MQQNPGSFRDPSGSVYETEDGIVRTVNEQYKPHFELLIKSGLYKKLVDKNYILSFTEREDKPDPPVWKMLCVEKLPVISYPYEWSFQQLKDAAILTLRIQHEALKHGLVLKDATAYNVQFFKGKPVFIDLLSFEEYKEGEPWIAYRQFVQHFVGPLLLMSRKDIRYGILFRNFLDGFPVDFIANNLPWSSRWSPSIYVNVHLHAKMIKKYEDTHTEFKERKTTGSVSLKGLQNMTEGLFTLVNGIKNPLVSTEWGDYYNDTNYDDAAFREKGALIEKITEKFKPCKTVDLGANLGEFSRIFAKHSGIVLSPDIDPVAVNKNYLLVAKNKEHNIYPLVQDLTNPSPGIGWMNEERASFVDRAKCDLAAGLALIHHLCIGNNVPLDKVAVMFRKLSDKAIVEFVPKEDSQVKRLLSSREDIFPDYDLGHCIEAFGKHYPHCEQIPIAGTCRTLLVFSQV